MASLMRGGGLQLNIFLHFSHFSGQRARATFSREESAKEEENAWSRVRGTCDEMSGGHFPRSPRRGQPLAAAISGQVPASSLLMPWAQDA